MPCSKLKNAGVYGHLKSGRTLNWPKIGQPYQLGFKTANVILIGDYYKQQILQREGLDKVLKK
jgi:hypothetical protein